MKTKESKWIKCVDCGLKTAYVVKCKDGRNRCCQCAEGYGQQKPKEEKDEFD